MSSEQENTYMADPTDLKELARLIRQERGIAATIPEPFPDRIWKSFRDVLDVGCGPGGWVLDKAARWPKIRFTGIDISDQMLKHANMFAMAERINNVSFLKMDAQAGLAFPDESFDFINCHYIYAFLLPKQWPAFLAECHRILRPGGHIVFFDYETVYSNSKSFDLLAVLPFKAAFVLQRTFSPTGSSSGISAALKPLLRKAGFREINHQMNTFECAPGQPEFETWKENTLLMAETMQSFVVRAGVITQEELQDVLTRGFRDMDNPDFSAISCHFLASAIK